MVCSFVASASGAEVLLKLDDATLKGELTEVEKKSSKVAFFISGSGASDRNGNTAGSVAKSDCLKLLSDYLNDEQIATLRVDKRGVGASAGVGKIRGMKEADLRFSTYVGDVVHWVKFLKENGYSEIVLIGHSEGALVGTLAAQKESVSGLISVAGAGRPAGVILREQVKTQFTEKNYKLTDEIISRLEKGELVKDYPKTLELLFRGSVQPYLISWFKIDPAQELAKLSIPVLIVQGTTDFQVLEKDAKLLNKTAKNGKLELIEGMNHVLKQTGAGRFAQTASYMNPKIPLHQDLGDIVVRFTQQLK